MKKIELIQNKFYRDEDGNIKIQFYGTFRGGLTQEEIKDYLRARVNQVRIETVYKKFCENAGVNTMTGYNCPCCDYSTGLMYRHDVQRFTDLTLEGKATYFD